MHLPPYRRRTYAGLLFAIFAPFAPVHAVTDGYIDGIYQCTVALGGKTSLAFMSLNGRQDGKTVYMVAADRPEQDGYSGYGLGLITGNKFAGNTSFNKRFEFTIGYADSNAANQGFEQVTLRGTVGVVVAGRATNARVDCISIW